MGTVKDSMKMSRNYICFLPQSSPLALIIHYWSGSDAQTHTGICTSSFLSKSITRQFAHPLLKEIALHLFILNKLYYHLLKCIMCLCRLSWLALRFHDKEYKRNGYDA